MINIFTNVRTKLTLYYLTIIMVISLFFSLIIYSGATRELNRIESLQRIRRPNPQFLIDPDLISETKVRILFSLLSLNTLILVVSGISGYFLAGKTLDPIKEMLDEQKEFVSNASHELRTPLASLKSQIEVALRDKKMTLKDAKELLTSNLEDVNNMTRLSNYLLKLNNFQDGKARLELKDLDLSELVVKAAGKKKVKLNLVKTIINGNEDSLTELVNILIDNAIKYGNNKEVDISLNKKILKITDKGIGIPKTDLPHIFDRFFRGDKARHHDGYGLGLSIAKQIADSNNAKIKVDSKLGVGTTFKVIFS